MQCSLCGWVTTAIGRARVLLSVTPSCRKLDTAFLFYFPRYCSFCLFFKVVHCKAQSDNGSLTKSVFFFLWHHLVLSTALPGRDCVCARPPFLCVSVGLGDASAKAAKIKKTEVNHEPDTLPQPTPFFTFVLKVFFFFCVCVCLSTSELFCVFVPLLFFSCAYTAPFISFFFFYVSTNTLGCDVTISNIAFQLTCWHVRRRRLGGPRTQTNKDARPYCQALTLVPLRFFTRAAFLLLFNSHTYPLWTYADSRTAQWTVVWRLR